MLCVRLEYCLSVTEITGTFILNSEENVCGLTLTAWMLSAICLNSTIHDMSALSHEVITTYQ